MLIPSCKFLKHSIRNILVVLNLIFCEESTDFFKLNHILHQTLILLLPQMMHPIFVESGAQVIEQYPKIVSEEEQY
jgi:hypothetical protein